MLVRNAAQGLKVWEMSLWTVREKAQQKWPLSVLCTLSPDPQALSCAFCGSLEDRRVFNMLYSSYSGTHRRGLGGHTYPSATGHLLMSASQPYRAPGDLGNQPGQLTLEKEAWKGGGWCK